MFIPYFKVGALGQDDKNGTTIAVSTKAVTGNHNETVGGSAVAAIAAGIAITFVIVIITVVIFFSYGHSGGGGGNKGKSAKSSKKSKKKSTGKSQKSQKSKAASTKWIWPVKCLFGCKKTFYNKQTDFIMWPVLLNLLHCIISSLWS